MSPTSKRHAIPCVHSFTYKTTAKTREESETQALCLNLSQFHPLLILFTHLTQSFICTSGNLLIPLEEFCSLCLYFLTYGCIKIQLEHFFRIINSQLHLFNFNEETEMNHIYVFVSIRYFTMTIYTASQTKG